MKYRGANLKHRLQKHFGESLVFFRNVKRMTDPELVTSAHVPRAVLLGSVAENLPNRAESQSESHSARQ